jgi:hypothetical protein
MSEAPPDWIRDLLGLHLTADLRSETAKMGFGSVSPMFANAAFDSNDESDLSYSSAELVAMREAMERLKDERPVEWAELQRYVRPRSALGLVDKALVDRAYLRLAAWVDEAMGD